MATNSEYLSSNTAIAYPFRDDAAGLQRPPSVTGMPLDVFVDAAFEVPAAFAAGKQLYLGRTTKIDGSTLTVVITDGSSDIVELTLIATLASPYATAVATANGITARLVADCAALFRYLIVDGTLVYDATLPFEFSTQDVINPSVLSLTLYNHGPDAPPEGDAIVGDVQILSGHNINASLDTIEADTIPVTLHAVAGAGIGRQACTHALPPFTNTPKGLTPEKGNIDLVPGDEGCYVIVPHPGTGIIQIQGRCQACCTCDDMVDVLEYLKALGSRIVAVQSVLDGGRERYEFGVTKFNQIIAKDYTRVAMKANGMRGSDWPVGVQKRGAPNWVRIVLTFTNRRTYPATITTWGMGGSFEVVEDVAWEMGGQGGKTTIGGTLPSIPRDRKLSVTILAKTAGVGWSGTITATSVETFTGQTDVLQESLTIS